MIDLDVEWKAFLPHHLSRNEDLAAFAIGQLMAKTPLAVYELLPQSLSEGEFIKIVATPSRDGSPLAVPTLLIAYSRSALLLHAKHLSELDTLSKLTYELLGIVRIRVYGADGLWTNDLDVTNNRWVLWG